MDRVAVPVVRLHIAEGIAQVLLRQTWTVRQSVQYGNQHPPGYGAIGGEVGVRGAMEQVTGGDKVHILLRPVICPMDIHKAQAAVNDLYHSAAIGGQEDAVFCDDGLLHGDFDAIRFHHHGHCAGGRILDGNLHLYCAAAFGDIDLNAGGVFAIGRHGNGRRQLYRLVVLLGLLHILAGHLDLCLSDIAVFVGGHCTGGAGGGLVGGCGRAVLLGLDGGGGAVRPFGDLGDRAGDRVLLGGDGGSVGLCNSGAAGTARWRQG